MHIAMVSQIDIGNPLLPWGLISEKLINTYSRIGSNNTINSTCWPVTNATDQHNVNISERHRFARFSINCNPVSGMGADSQTNSCSIQQIHISRIIKL